MLQRLLWMSFSTPSSERSFRIGGCRISLANVFIKFSWSVFLINISWYTHGLTKDSHRNVHTDNHVPSVVNGWRNTSKAAKIESADDTDSKISSFQLRRLHKSPQFQTCNPKISVNKEKKSKRRIFSNFFFFFANFINLFRPSPPRARCLSHASCRAHTPGNST